MTRSFSIVAGILLMACACLAQSSDAAYREGLAALQQGRIDEARQRFQQVLEADAGAGSAWLALGRVELQAGRSEEAQRAVERAAGLIGQDPKLAHGVALYYAEIGDAARAGEFEAQFARSSGEPQAFLQAVTALLQAGLSEDAIRLAEEGLAKFSNPTLENMMGKALAEAGRREEAEKALRGAMTAEPYNEEFHYDLGYLFLQAAQFDRAVETFEASRKIFDKSPRIELGIGVARYGQRRFREAVDAFLRVSRLVPGMPQPHYFLGEILEHADDRLDEVRERFDAFAEASPENYLAPFLQAKARLAADGLRPSDETLEVAEGLLRRSINLRNDFWESHFELGVVLDRRKQLDEAVASLRKAIELSPKSPTPHYRLSRVYARLGKSELAEQESAEHTRLEAEMRQSLQGGMTPGTLK